MTRTLKQGLCRYWPFPSTTGSGVIVHLSGATSLRVGRPLTVCCGAVGSKFANLWSEAHALLVLTFLVPAIVYLARSISRPLAKLSDEAELIQSFQLGEPIKLESRVVEINALIRSMSGMKSRIREVSKFVPKE
jgi:methyl-accepting chemotaxis protein